MWRGKGPTLTAIVRAGHDKTQMKDVVKQLVGTLPTDGVALVRLTASGQNTERAAYDEDSMLNGR